MKHKLIIFLSNDQINALSKGHCSSWLPDSKNDLHFHRMIHSGYFCREKVNNCHYTNIIEIQYSRMRSLALGRFFNTTLNTNYNAFL